MNTTSIFYTKRESPWLLSENSKGLGYMSTPVLSNSESEESPRHVTYQAVGAIFRNLSVNMISTSHLEHEDEEMIQSDNDSLITHLNTLGDIRFKQREPSTED